MTAPTEQKPQTSEDGAGHGQARTFLLAAFTAIGLYLCYLLAAPFLSTLTWAIALAVLFMPLQVWLESKLRHPNIAALVSVLIIGLIVVVPTTFVVQHLVIQAAKGAALVETKVNSGDWRRAIEAQPRLAPMVDKIEQDMDLPGAVKSVAAWLSTTAGTIVKGSMFQAISFCLIFYLLFFFLRDRHAALHSLRYLSPLSNAEMALMCERINGTIHATVYGTLSVSAIQGLLGGLMFWGLELPAPLLWGVVMAILAVVPMLGAFIVWIPAALFLAMEGSWGRALILTLWGILVVGTVDNLLRPILVSNRLKLHTVLAFVSILGGLMFFGASGLILGPVILTITTVLLQIWHTRSEPATAVDHPMQTQDSGLLTKTSIERWENEGGCFPSCQRQLAVTKTRSLPTERVNTQGISSH
jgi:predicted PurR-regulated permease PerM